MNRSVFKKILRVLLLIIITLGVWVLSWFFIIFFPLGLSPHDKFITLILIIVISLYFFKKRYLRINREKRPGVF